MAAIAPDLQQQSAPGQSFKKQRQENSVDRRQLREATRDVYALLERPKWDDADEEKYARLVSTDDNLKTALGETLWFDIVERYRLEVGSGAQSESDETKCDVEERLSSMVQLCQRYTRLILCFGSRVAICKDCLSVANRDLIAGSSFAIVEKIQDDLYRKRESSPCRDALLAMCEHDLWRELLCIAANQVIVSQAAHWGRASHFPDDDLDSDEGNAFHDAATECVTSDLLKWIDDSIAPTLVAWAPTNVDDLVSQLKFEACTSLGRLRARQLFDIISDFPESTPALNDLIDCSQEVDLKPYISSQLNKALHTRLLHPGASTQDIIQFYTHLIRSLRVVDPSGVILSHVIGPVRTYLRARADTVPVIVASLLGQAGDFTLLRDLMRESGTGTGPGAGVGKAIGDTSVAMYDEADEAEIVDIAAMDESKRLVFIPPADEDWAPRPTDAGPDFRQSRKSDVVAIIASIFEDEEGFIAALERSCASQFLRVRGYDTSAEYETNENLKKRFGDAWLSRCDVMLKDIKKSQRYDQSIHRGLAGMPQDDQQSLEPLVHLVHPFILSRQFWPELKTEAASQGMPMGGPARGPGQAAGAPSVMFSTTPSISHGRAARIGVKANGATGNSATDAARTATEMQIAEMLLPPKLSATLEQYGAQFCKVVNGRRVRWLPGRGDVHVRLTMDDGRVIDERVLPIQAALIELAARSSEMKGEIDENEEMQSRNGEQDGGHTKVLLLSDAISQLRVDARHVIEAAAFWISRGVLRQVEPGAYSIIEHA